MIKKSQVPLSARLLEEGIDAAVDLYRTKQMVQRMGPQAEEAKKKLGIPEPPSATDLLKTLIAEEREKEASLPPSEILINKALMKVAGLLK